MFLSIRIEILNKDDLRRYRERVEGLRSQWLSPTLSCSSYVLERLITWYIDLQRISRTLSNAVPEERRSIVEKSVAYKPEQRPGIHRPLSSSIKYFIIFEHHSAIHGTSSRGQGGSSQNFAKSLSKQAREERPCILIRRADPSSESWA